MHSVFCPCTVHCLNVALQLEREIGTLRSVLSNKMRRAHELKQRLGISVWTEVKGDFAAGINDIKSSDT